MHRRSASSLLLAELILSIFFFLAAAAVSVQIFAAASKEEDAAKQNQQLSQLLRNCEESFDAADGDPEKTLQGLSALYPDLADGSGDNTATLPVDLAGEDGDCTLTLAFSGESAGNGTLHHLALSVTGPDGSTICEQELSSFEQEARDAKK
ncbi:MAG: hypothetical protein ACI4OJ_02035 [Lachnospiraceae bacterium]